MGFRHVATRIDLVRNFLELFLQQLGRQWAADSSDTLVFSSAFASSVRNWSNRSYPIQGQVF